MPIKKHSSAHETPFLPLGLDSPICLQKQCLNITNFLNITNSKSQGLSKRRRAGRWVGETGPSSGLSASYRRQVPPSLIPWV